MALKKGDAALPVTATSGRNHECLKTQREVVRQRGTAGNSDRADVARRGSEVLKTAAKTHPYQFQFTSQDGLRMACARWDSGRPFYPGGRHEMLNEINRAEVRANLLRWISYVLERRENQPTTWTPRRSGRFLCRNLRRS